MGSEIFLLESIDGKACRGNLLQGLPHLGSGLAEPLGRPWLKRALGSTPGVRAVAAHAFWIVGSKA